MNSNNNPGNYPGNNYNPMNNQNFNPNFQQPNMPMKQCKYCGQYIPKKAKFCSYCSRKQSDLGGAFKAVIIALALIIFVPLIIGSCSRSSKSSSSSQPDVEVSTSNKIQDSSADDTAPNAVEAAKEAAEEDKNTVLYDDNGIKVTYTGIEEHSISYDIKLLIENNTDVNYTVQAADFSVNGFMTTGLLSCSVAAKKKANDKIMIPKSQLEDSGITDIENVEFTLHIFNSDDWTNSIDSDPISIDFK